MHLLNQLQLQVFLCKNQGDNGIKNFFYCLLFNGNVIFINTPIDNALDDGIITKKYLEIRNDVVLHSLTRSD